MRGPKLPLSTCLVSSYYAVFTPFMVYLKRFGGVVNRRLAQYP